MENWSPTLNRLRVRGKRGNDLTVGERGDGKEGGRNLLRQERVTGRERERKKRGGGEKGKEPVLGRAYRGKREKMAG